MAKAVRLIEGAEFEGKNDTSAVILLVCMKFSLGQPLNVTDLMTSASVTTHASTVSGGVNAKPGQTVTFSDILASFDQEI